MERNIISMADISKELNKVTSVYLIANTVKMQRVGIVTSLISSLMINPRIDRSELALFIDVLEDQYIGGSSEINDCYNIYLDS